MLSDSGRSERSIADANRPDRRAVLDRERARAVAEKQAEALQATKELAEKKAHQKIQVLLTPSPRLSPLTRQSRTYPVVPTTCILGYEHEHEHGRA